MKITIELDESYIQILAEWVSVSTTLNTAKKACAYINTENLTVQEKFLQCEKELNAIEPALNYLHQLVRQEIWKQNQ